VGSVLAHAKAATHASADGYPLHSFRGLLNHLGGLTRSTIHIGGVTFDKISDPTPVQLAHPPLVIPQVLVTNQIDRAAAGAVPGPDMTGPRAAHASPRRRGSPR
jgi:hypothetical protein